MTNDKFQFDIQGAVSILVASLAEALSVKRVVWAIILGLLVLQGCRSAGGPEGAALSNLPPPNPPAGSENEVIATVQGDIITRKDLEPVLIEGYGLKALLVLVQLDLAEQEAARQHVAVTPDDVANERAITMDNLRREMEQMESNGQPTTQPQNLSTEQENQLLDQLLAQQHVSRAEFGLILKVNAYLRKMAEPKVNANLTEDEIRRQFNVMYGEKVVVHYIVCNNMSEVADVRRDLAAGKSFEDVARLRSVDRRTAALGGELPPFTLSDTWPPPEFKQVVFNLKVGEVSDAVQIHNHIYIAKLIDVIPPAHARFEDYRDVVKKELYDSTVQAAMGTMRDQLAKQALGSLRIRNPVLAQQWADRINNQNGQIHDEKQIRQELDKQHAPAQSGPITPATPPATRPATAP
ncbi:MAG: peptidyl-prolyl cis-trans isomerase [Tepidisphaeraceae bacterium]|jgi:foldase protein PrsA